MADLPIEVVLGTEREGNPVALLQADHVDLAPGQTPGHRPAGCPGADDEDITLVAVAHLPLHCSYALRQRGGTVRIRPNRLSSNGSISAPEMATSYRQPVSRSSTSRTRGWA